MDVLGISFEGPIVRIAKGQKRGKQFFINGLKSFVTPLPEDVKQFYNLSSGGWSSGVIDCIVRPIEFSIPSIREVEKGLSFQIETLLYAPSEEIVHTSILTRIKKGVQALVFLCRRENLMLALTQWEQLSLEPDFLGPSSIALISFIRFRCPNLLHSFLVHLGSTEWICVWMQNGKLKKSFTILEGIDLPTKQTYLKNTLVSFQETAGVHPIFFTGHADSFASILENLPEAILYEPEIPLAAEERLCALAIGAALQCTEKNSPQFLQHSLTPGRVLKKAGKQTVAFFLGSLAISLTLIFFGKIQLDSQKKMLETSSLDQTLSIIEKYPVENPHLLQAPTVTEVLSWLSKHQSIYAEDPIQWIDIGYRLIEFPQIGAIKSPYKAKIDLEFQVKNPITARKFHETLLQDKEFIDQTKEISWEVFSENYRTSFCLKNRTPYEF